MNKIKNIFRGCRFQSKSAIFLTIVAILVIVTTAFCASRVYFYKNEIAPPPAPPIATTTLQDADWEIDIVRTDMRAPVILNVNGADKDTYFKALESGVAHMQGTALPGKGNTVIFGHSSFYDSSPGEYKTIFKELDRLETGDSITLKSGNRTLNYKVTSSEIVYPDDVAVTRQTNDKKLTLITCWPPGSIDNRLVVSAKFIQ